MEQNFKQNILNKKIEKKNLFGPNLRQSIYDVIFWRVMVGSGVGSVDGGQKIKVAQNDLKHVSVSKFLKSDEIFEIFYLS